MQPGWALVRTSFLRPSRTLIREDLPTLERPRKATSGNSPAGSWSLLWTLRLYSAEIIFGMVMSVNLVNLDLVSRHYTRFPENTIILVTYGSAATVTPGRGRLLPASLGPAVGSPTPLRVHKG